MQSFMRESDCDAIAFTSAEWAEWAFNFQIIEKTWERPILVVVTKEGRALAFLADMSGPAATAAFDAEQLWVDELAFYADTPLAERHNPWNTGNWDEMVAKGLAKAGLGRARIAVDALSGPMKKVAERLPEATLYAAEGSFRSLRWIKHPEEVETMRAGASLSEWAMQRLGEELQPGRQTGEADHSVAAMLMAEAARRHPDAAFHVMGILSLGNPDSAYLNPVNSRVDRRVEPDTVLISQISTRLNGMTTEFTRPLLVGSPSRELVGYVECVREAQEAGIAAAVPGAPVNGIQTAAQNVIERAGHGAHCRLRAGHGIGVIMHDFPEDLPFAERPLQVGELYSIEPGIYIPRIGGFRYADTIMVREEGAERITRGTKDLDQLRISTASSRALSWADKA
ncbi:M24 family metallopeptidase [Phenylobacterium sp.]|jgi:Xaa-Pro aminopeptidase|uniref:M24 family metallopeptidase n=1 Tax=Phenylobacterium sp. TaxID=1871053 RepID=UPI002E3357B4|nr:M24 family metallopeptidase [Phenylobacterium sp.]HEX3366084.1 M24 family metallopeptidase [Phenylobacterium sp.]